MGLNIVKDYFQKAGKEQNIMLFTMQNSEGTEVAITNYGATVTSIKTKDKSGKPGQIVCGFDNIEQFKGDQPFFGAVCGRYANRIANGKFSLEGKEYSLAINNAPNTLHGGNKGFDKVVWDYEVVENAQAVGIKLTYVSKDMEEGYPGTLTATVTYLLNENNELQIHYTAKTDKTTVVNLTNHAYYNLGGFAGEVTDHLLQINANSYTETDNTSIPTGKIIELAGTAYDFRELTLIGDRIKGTANGYDDNFILNKAGQPACSFTAKVVHPGTGRTMEVYTTEPGVQFYSANYLDGTIKGHDGVVYKKRFALCLETQHFPDSPNHGHFPNTVLKPGETYTQTTIHKFGVTGK